MELSTNEAKKRRTSATKKNWCQYCNSFQTKIARHMTALHKNVSEVQKYLNLKSKKEKREFCKSIINSSNKIYNEKVLNHKSIGKMIPVKKTKAEADFTTHVVCSTCGGLFAKKYFYSHKTTCIKRLEMFGNQVKVPSSQAVNKHLNNKYQLLKERVIDNMNNDKIKLTILNDFLILEYGRRFLKCHMGSHQRNYVSNKMRSLSDLVLRVKKLKESVQDLKDCLDPLNFNVLCEAVKKWSKYNENNGICSIGSVPRRLCKSLKSCSQILWSEAIKDDTLSYQQQLECKTKHERFMSLMSSDWQMEINSAADKSLKIKKVLGEGKMPLEDDLVTYFEGLTKIIKKLTSQVTNEHSIKDFDNITQATLAFLIAFNSRRPGEVAHATVDNYKNIVFDADKTQNEPLAVFYVAATKNDTKVPIIVPHVTYIATEAILKCRSHFKIPGNILFSTLNGSAYNGSEVLSKFKSKLPLKKPDDFTANGIRHFWATMSQTDSELKKHMPKFLGHTLATHQKYYEMPLADIQLKLIGPVLKKKCLSSQSSIDSNLISNCKHFKEQKTDHVSPEKLPNFRIQPNIRIQPNRKSSLKRGNFTPNESEVSDQPDDTSEDPDFQLDTATLKKKNLLRRKNSQTFSSSSDDDSITSSLLIRQKNLWITPEKTELFESMPKTILGIEPAGRGKIKEVWENSKLIKLRHSLQTTRIEVSKYYTKKKKISTPIKKNLLVKVGVKDSTLD